MLRIARMNVVSASLLEEVMSNPAHVYCGASTYASENPKRIRAITGTNLSRYAKH